MKILIAGANGFIGRYLVNDAIKKGFNIITATRNSPYVGFKDKKNIKNIVIDIRDIDTLELTDIDVCINLAATGVSPRVANWEQLMQINVDASLKICQFAKKVGARLIQIGSFCEYGESGENYKFIPVDAPLLPTYPYAISKACSFQLTSGYALTECLELAYLRLFNVFGDGQYHKNIWPSLKSAAMNNEDFLLTPGEQIRDFISVEEVSQIILKISCLPSSLFKKPLILNIGSGKPQSVLEFCQYWWAKWGANSKLKPGFIDYRPKEVMRYVPVVEKQLLFK